MPLGINLGTQAYVNFDVDGTVNTQVVNVNQGTITANIDSSVISNIDSIESSLQFHPA